MNTHLQELNANETNNENCLTVERLRQYQGLENLTDEQALNIIQSVSALCQIAGRAALELSNAA